MDQWEAQADCWNHGWTNKKVKLIAGEVLILMMLQEPINQGLGVVTVRKVDQNERSGVAPVKQIVQNFDIVSF